MTQHPVIVTQDLSKSYRGVTALADLNLTVPRHSIFGFLGPNGSGKSTTFKLLLGLIRPTRGRGAVFGLDITRDSAAIRRRVGYLAQNPRFYDELTPRQTLRFVARFFYTGPAAALQRRIAASLDLVGLTDKADRPIQGFSGGERQRLGIAQAHLSHPDLLILDEPAAALDPMGRRDVLEIMARLRQQSTILYSTHILDDVQRVSDTVAIMNRGRLVAQAPIKQLLAGSTGFSVTLRGDPAAARQRLAEQPWVTGVTAVGGAEQTRWEVEVSDMAAAEDRLLRLILADEHCTVIEFARRADNLEAAFMRLVEGDSNGR